MSSEISRPPSVDWLIRLSGLEGFSIGVRTDAARRVQVQLREGGDPLALMRAACEDETHAPPTVINASGIILHTGLGRARLATDAAEAMRRVAAEPTAVEFDLASGTRGDRQALVREQLRALTGAEDALVVNNCAGAVLLALSALARGCEVLLSRGQMVEIGGEFRMPDVIRASGCRLVEVGCTNRTHLRDYASAINQDTAAILRCHPSNFWMEGFVASVSVRDLASLKVDVIDDMGSGNLVNTQALGLPAEPTIAESIRDGAGLVLASGDKLLGGPQAGIIVGRGDLIQELKRHPIARALRIDKASLAGLHATLQHHLRGDLDAIPTWRAITRPLADLEKVTERVAAGLPVDVVASEAEVGGGAFPGHKLPSVAIAAPEHLLEKLRMWTTPIIGRKERGKVLLDLRTCMDAEVATVRTALESVLGKNND